jgi:hypothetical protein
MVEQDAAYTAGADEAEEMMALAGQAGGACAQCCGDMLQAEIIRDAFQQIGMFFSSIQIAGFRDGPVKFFGFMYNFVAVDVYFFFKNVDVQVWLGLLAVVSVCTLVAAAYYLCAAFKMLPNELEQGNEAKDFRQLKEENPSTMKGIKYTLTIMGFLYLPISKISIQVVRCSQTDGLITQMNSAGLSCKAVRPIAVALLLVCTLTVPVVYYHLVTRTKPRGSLKDPNMCFDAGKTARSLHAHCALTAPCANTDGINFVEFTDELYQRRMKEDESQVHSPFLFLYHGYERRWAYYKAVVMVLKLLLALAVIVPSAPINQAIVALVVMVVYTSVTAYTTPFIDGRKDKTEMSGKICGCLTLLFAIIAAKASQGSESSLQLCTFVTNGVNVVIMAVMSILGMKSVQAKLANFFKTLYFANTVTGSGEPERADQTLPSWDVPLEIRHRVWWPFWSTVQFE